MNIRWFVLTALSLGAAAQAQLNAPKVGTLRQADGTVHALYGIHANFVNGPASDRDVRAVSFSDRAGLIALQDRIELLGIHGEVLGAYDSRESNPILNVDGEPTTALAYLPSQHALLHWNGNSFDLSTVNTVPLPGVVTSLQTQDAKTAKLILTGDRGAFQAIVSLSTGELQSVTSLSGAHGSIFEHQGLLLFHDQAGFTVESPNGLRRILPIQDADIHIDRMSTDWLHLHSDTSQRDWALHLNNKTMELAELPVMREVRK